MTEAADVVAGTGPAIVSPRTQGTLCQTSITKRLHNAPQPAGAAGSCSGMQHRTAAAVAFLRPRAFAWACAVSCMWCCAWRGPGAQAALQAKRNRCKNDEAPCNGTAAVLYVQWACATAQTACCTDRALDGMLAGTTQHKQTPDRQRRPGERGDVRQGKSRQV